MRCRILRLPEVLERTGLSRSTLFRRMRAGEFPQSVKLGRGQQSGCWLVRRRGRCVDGRVEARVMWFGPTLYQSAPSKPGGL